jgi:hypothetical protein
MDKLEIGRVFTYWNPDPHQIDDLVVLRSKAYELGLLIIERVPDCADRTAAIRKLRECIMTANAAIVIPRD